MIVIAGPSGSGKSRHFPASEFGVASFNVDDRCAALNRGSYHSTPPHVRQQAQQACEAFVAECTARGESFAVETTLRSPIAIDQAERARAAGFTIKMIFVATSDALENVMRVVRRGLDGGHSAPEARVIEIYRRSLVNLGRALAVFDELALYDNSALDRSPRLVRVYAGQEIVFDEPPLPHWLVSVLDRA